MAAAALTAPTKVDEAPVVTAAPMFHVTDEQTAPFFQHNIAGDTRGKGSETLHGRDAPHLLAAVGEGSRS